MNFDELGWRSIAIFRLAGYALLFLSFVDTINIFIPPRFTNPVWEFQVIGELVEKMPVPLIGFAFIFFGKDKYRRGIEEILLKILSWVALILGIAFLLLLPLGIVNTIRINNLNNFQINSQFSQRINQLQQVNAQLSKANSEADITNILTNLNFQSRSPKIDNPQEIKARIVSDITKTQKQLQSEIETVRQTQKISLLKSSVKWNLGALLAGVLFIYVWKLTNWTRE